MNGARPAPKGKCWDTSLKLRGEGDRQAQQSPRGALLREHRPARCQGTGGASVLSGASTIRWLAKLGFRQNLGAATPGRSSEEGLKSICKYNF